MASGGIWTRSDYSYWAGDNYLVDPANGIFNRDELALKNFQWRLTAVPEPHSICLALLALAAFGGRFRRPTMPRQLCTEL